MKKNSTRRPRDHVNSRQARLPRCRLITKSSESTSDNISLLSKSTRPVISGDINVSPSSLVRSRSPSIETKSKCDLSRMIGDARNRKLDPVKPIRMKAREELKSLGGAPRVEKHTHRGHTRPCVIPPYFLPSLPATLTPLAVRNDTMPCCCRGRRRRGRRRRVVQRVERSVGRERDRESKRE